MKRYNNYHKHTHYSNIKQLDCAVKPIHYIERAKELGHTTYFTTEHGWGGNIWEAKTLCKETKEQKVKRIENEFQKLKYKLKYKTKIWLKFNTYTIEEKLKLYKKYKNKFTNINFNDYNLDLIFGVEAYYVDNRFEKDRGNYHIILIALNNDGFQDINRVISEANKTGFYYKPRIDLELLLSLNPKNVVVTTACVASRLFKSKDYEDKFLIPIHNHFKNNLFLETQCHNEDIQKIHNKKILELSEKYNIKIIHANDSHYINKEDSKYRNKFLKGKDINYPDEVCMSSLEKCSYLLPIF